MNKRFPILVLLLIVLNGCTSKTNDETATANNDSIQKYIALAGNETLPFDKRIKYNDKALGFIDLERNDSLTRKNLYKMSSINCSLLNFDNVKKISHILIDKSLKTNDSVGLAKGYYSLGFYYMTQSENEKAIENYLIAKKIFALKGLKKEQIKVLINLATTQSYANDFLGSIKTSYKILGFSKKLNLQRDINNSYLNIANNLSYLKNNRKAIDYYKKIRYDSSEYNESLNLNNNIAWSYIELNQFDKAIYILQKSLKSIDIKAINPDKKAINYSLTGLCFLKKNQQKKALHYFIKAEKIFISTTMFGGRNYNYLYLSIYYEKIIDLQTSIKYAKKSVDISKSYKNPNDILSSLKQLIKVDKKNAYTYAQDYIRISDSLQIAERNFRDKFAQITFETDEITQQKDNAIKQRAIVTVFASTLLFITVLIIIIARQRIKQKELRLKQSQQKANEELYQLILNQKDSEEKARYLEKKRIAMELHDGVMNKLTSTRLNLSVLSIKKDEATIEKCLGYIKEINLVENEIRNITHDLNRETFHSSNSFSKLLEDFVEEQNGISNTHFIVEVDSSIDWNIISNITKMNLYRIIQETVHNINKHAKAQKGIINLIMDRKNICLSVIDDGVGIELSTNEQGIGLKNIEHRVKQLKGKLNIHTKSNSGTSINISLPLEKAD